MKASQVRRIFHILLTIALIVAGLCLIGGALYIFYSGGKPIYTLQKINDTFRAISIPVYVALAFVVSSFIVELFLPAPGKRREKNYALILSNLQQRANLEQCGDRDLRNNIINLRKQRKWLSVISLVLLGICSVVFLIYALRGENYPPLTASEQDHGIINRAMMQNAIIWAVCITIPFIFNVFAAYMTRASMRTEIDLLRHVAQNQKPSEIAVKNCATQLIDIRLVLVYCAVGLIGLGAIGEGWRDVLTKAINICTECVGLG